MMSGSYAKIQPWPTNSATITQNSQELDSEDQFPYILAPASDSGTTKETQIFFQINQNRCLTPAEPASSFTLPTTSNESLYRTTFPPESFPTSLPASGSLPDRSHGGDSLAIASSELGSLCLFPFGWSSFTPTCSEAGCWNVHCLSFQKPRICQ